MAAACSIAMCNVGLSLAGKAVDIRSNRQIIVDLVQNEIEGNKGDREKKPFIYNEK